MSNFATLCNIQHENGNWPLEGSALGSVDKDTTLLSLAWLIKAVFPFQFFSYKATFLLDSHWIGTFFEVKRLRSNPAFYCFRMKKVALYEKKFASGIPALRSSMSTKIFQILSKYPLHPTFNFEAMK